MATEPAGEIHGLGEAMAKLKSLEQLPRKKALRFALRKAANLVRDKVKEGAERIDDPATSNSIAKNVTVRFDNARFRQTGELAMLVGIRGGSTSKARNAKNPGGDTYYWRFLELGTEKRKATPFMRPAIDDAGEAAITEFVQQFDKALVRAIRRANRGNE